MDEKKSYKGVRLQGTMLFHLSPDYYGEIAKDVSQT